MKFVQRKVTTSQSKYTATNFAEVKQQFLDAVVETVEMEEVCPELILNWDQTGIRIVSSSICTMDREGVSRIEMVGAKAPNYCSVLLHTFGRFPSHAINLQREDESMPPKISVSTKMACYTCSETLVH